MAFNSCWNAISSSFGTLRLYLYDDTQFVDKYLNQATSKLKIGLEDVKALKL